MGFGMSELLIIFVIVLILFGGKRLPGLGKALGDTMREFKKGLSSSAEEETPVERQAQIPRENNPSLPSQNTNVHDATVVNQTDREKNNSNS